MSNDSDKTGRLKRFAPYIERVFLKTITSKGYTGRRNEQALQHGNIYNAIFPGKSTKNEK